LTAVGIGRFCCILYAATTLKLVMLVSILVLAIRLGLGIRAENDLLLCPTAA